MSTTSPLFEPFALPCGAVLPNRLAKAAMEENLAEEGQLPGRALEALYARWARGGIGMMLTGNVMIAPDALTGPGNVVLQKGTPLAPFRAWTAAGKSGGGQFWMQISHPGRQVLAAMGEQALAPSATAVTIKGAEKLFGAARALTVAEIQEIIARFAATAALAEEAGFDGVQIHGAHGYLLSQFLSPLTNLRTDEWGGPIENRARMLIETVNAVRGAVKPGFAVSVKLNSADFQKGGFTLEEAKWVVGQLNSLGVDLVELSGGSYESPAMTGAAEDATGGATSSTMRREAYFVEFAREIASVAAVPLMVTGGVTRLETAFDALEKDAAGFGVSVLGLGRALAFEPDLPALWRDGRKTEVKIPQVNWSNQGMASVATLAVARTQLRRMAAGKSPRSASSPFWSLIRDQFRGKTLTKRYRRWRDGGAVQEAAA